MMTLPTILLQRPIRRLSVYVVVGGLPLAPIGGALPSHAAPQADPSDDSSRTSKALCVRGRTQACLDDHGEALSHFQRAIATPPNQIGTSFGHRGRRTRTRYPHIVRDARTYATDNADDHLNLAALLQRTDRPRDAIAAYQRLLSSVPQDTDGPLEVAHLQARLDRPGIGAGVRTHWRRS